MCGLTGIFTSRGLAEPELLQAARRMSDTIVHRGPDDVGTWADAASGVAFGFRRLAIIDLSQEGHQPMTSPSGRYVMIFNGEVYNFRELRERLRAGGAVFRGGSDTEVMLAAFEAWGVPASIPQFLGMFGVAVWDRHERCLYLFRDRLGIKPMYVYAEPGLVTFGSEIKTVAAGPAFDATLDFTAIAMFIRRLYIPAPASVFSRVRKLMPGHVLRITDPRQPLPESEAYWSLPDVASRGLANPFRGDATEALGQLESLLSDAVRCRMYADVPLGALLSGGIDSSVVVALMQEHASQPVRTFTIGFDDPQHDEAPHAAAIARHLGTNHTVLPVTGDDALALVDGLPDVCDEPLADPSIIPTLLVSGLARRHVTVALSGDGGDELFAGYNRYRFGGRIIPTLTRTPKPLRRLMAQAVSTVPARAWDWATGRLAPSDATRLFSEKARKFAALARSDSAFTMYDALTSTWPDPSPLGHHLPPAMHMLGAGLPAHATLLARMQFDDQRAYLPDDLLAKVDRASMKVSLEVRVPILDHRIVEFSWTLPDHLKLRGSVTKYLLREILRKRVPPALFERPKVGFSVPIDAWLRGPLYDRSRDLLLGNPGTVVPKATTEAAWHAFASRRVSGLQVWTLVTLLMWANRWTTARV